MTITKLIEAPIYKKIFGLTFSVITTLFLDLHSIILGMWFLMFVNVCFGIRVSIKNSKKEGSLFSKMIHEIKAKKLEETAGKGMSYLIIIISVSVLNKYIIDMDGFNFISEKASLIQITAGVLSFVELWGIGESFSKLYGINPVKWIYEIIKNREFVEPKKNKNE